MSAVLLAFDLKPNDAILQRPAIGNPLDAMRYPVAFKRPMQRLIRILIANNFKPLLEVFGSAVICCMVACKVHEMKIGISVGRILNVLPIRRTLK